MTKKTNQVNLSKEQMLEIAKMVAEQMAKVQIATQISEDGELEENVKEVQKVFNERTKAPKKAKKESPLQRAVRECVESNEDEEEIEEIEEEDEAPVIAKATKRKSKGIALPSTQSYFERLITMKSSKKPVRVKCRGYVFEYEGHDLGVCYKMFINRKKEYSKGANCWTIVDLKSGLQLSKVSHLNEVENEIAEIRDKLLNMYSSKEYKQACVNFTKAPTAC